MTKTQRDWAVFKKCAEHLEALRQRGYDVWLPEDYTEIEAAVRATGRERQTPMFSLGRNDFSTERAFWLFLTKDGVPVAGCAAKFDDLGHESIDSFLNRTTQMQYGTGQHPITSVAPPVIDELKRRLIYIGELERRADERGELAVLNGFMRLVMGWAALRWPDFDAMYAFVPTAHRKLVAGYGFTMWIERALTWREPVPEGRRNDHLLVATKRHHFYHLWSGD